MRLYVIRVLCNSVANTLDIIVDGFVSNQIAAEDISLRRMNQKLYVLLILQALIGLIVTSGHHMTL